MPGFIDGLIVGLKLLIECRCGGHLPHPRGQIRAGCSDSICAPGHETQGPLRGVHS